MSGELPDDPAKEQEGFMLRKPKRALIDRYEMQLAKASDNSTAGTASELDTSESTQKKIEKIKTTPPKSKKGPGISDKAYEYDPDFEPGAEKKKTTPPKAKKGPGISAKAYEYNFNFEPEVEKKKTTPPKAKKGPGISAKAYEYDTDFELKVKKKQTTPPKAKQGHGRPAKQVCEQDPSFELELEKNQTTLLKLEKNQTTPPKANPCQTRSVTDQSGKQGAKKDPNAVLEINTATTTVNMVENIKEPIETVNKELIENVNLKEQKIDLNSFPDESAETIEESLETAKEEPMENVNLKEGLIDLNSFPDESQ